MKLMKWHLVFFLLLTVIWGGNHSLNSSHQEDDPVIAYINPQDSYDLIPIDVKSGAAGESILLDYPAKILAVSPDGMSVYIVGEDRCQVQNVDYSTKAIKDIKKLENELNHFVLSADGEKIYLSYQELKRLDCLNLTNESLDHLVTLENLPRSLILDSHLNRLYVCCQDSYEILAVDLHTKKVKPFLHLDDLIDKLAITKDGHMLVAFHEGKGQLTTIDIAKKAVHASLKIESTKLEAIGFNQAGTHAYLVKENAQEIIPVNLKNNASEAAIPIDYAIDSIGFHVEAQTLFFDVTVASAGEQTLFQAKALKGERALYFWNFGDGIEGVSEEPAISHVYETAGEFTTTLTVSHTVPNPLNKQLQSQSTAIKTFEIIDLGNNNNRQKDGFLIPTYRADGPGVTPSITTATPSQSTITYSQSVTDTAVVTGTFIGGTPTGTVTFFVGATQLGSPVPLTPGPGNTATATSIAYTPSTVGNFQFTADYSGDATYNVSSDSSPTNAFTVTQDTSTTNLLSSINPSVFGQSITLTAQIALGRSNDLPTGTVTFMDGSTTLGTAPVVAGSASFPISTLSVGSHPLTAIYSGDVNYAGSTSNTLNQTVNQGTTSTSLSSSVNPLIFGNTTTLTASVNILTGAGTVTGTVTFRDGLTTIGTGTISGGVATLNVSNFAVGTHSLTAIYNGDVNFSASTSSAVSQVVNQGTTTSSVSSSVNPSTYGQSTTFTATVAVATGIGTPTGFFTFKNGATVLGTVNLTGLSATLAISNLPVGANSITAVYSGDLNFQTSTSSILTQQVDPAGPIITLSSSLNPSTYGELVTFTSTVAAPTTLGIPSGTVSFFDGATLLGTGTLAPSGANISTATFAIDTLSGGANSITAVYSGDTNFTTVTSSVLTQNVNQVITTTTIFSSSPNPSQFGEPVILKANIAGAVALPPLSPSGTVTFFDGATPLGTVPVTMLSANTGTATLTVTTLSIGTHALTASYSGDINYISSLSSSMTQKVIFSGTANTTTTSQTPSVFGQLVTFTSTVTATIPGMGSPTGTVEFYDGVQLLGTGTLVSTGPTTSQATFSTSGLSLGSHHILSNYTGDINFSGAVAPLITQVVNQDSTSTALTSSLNPSNFGDNITLTATVTANAPGSGIPTGTVTFKEGATVLGTGTLNGSGVATFSTIALYPGTHTLTATYSGDLNFITSTSPNLNQVVNNQLDTVTTVTSFRNSSPINQAVTYSARVTAITGTPTGTVTFYDNGVPFGTGTLNGSGVATVTEPAGMLGTLGLHPITAIYSGDANFITSTSPTFSQYVVPYDTATVLAIIPNPSTQAGAFLQATVTASGTPTPIPVFTGTVTFYENGVALSPALTVPPSGIVTFQPDDLHFGSRTIIAIYSGDQTQFATSTSNPVTQQVQQTDMLTTDTTLSSSLSTSYSCESITLTASVVATQGFYTPTGTVAFFADGQAIGAAVLNNAGIATLTVSSLAVGTHTLVATYNSDSNYAFSTSNSITQTVIANPTTTTLSLIPNLPSTPYTQTLNFVMQVQAANGIPTGTITLADESGAIVTLDLDATGLAVYTTNTLPAGVHSFTATYDPVCCPGTTACFGASTATLSHTITPIDSRLILTAAPSPAVYGDTITLTGSVSSYSSGTPSGTVTFYKGSTLIGTAPIIQGIATIEVANLPAGVTIFNATYNGDNDFIPKNFPSAVDIITKAEPQISLIPFSQNPTVVGEPVSLSASVSSWVSSPTGTVTFFSGSTNLGQATLNGSGLATIQTSSLPLGANPIRAVYSGSTNFLTAVSGITVLTVNQAATTTTITTTTPSPSTFNTPVTVNVTVAPISPGSGIPTGTVTGYYGSVVLGTAPLNNGVASFSTTVLPAGTPTITVVYGGDTNFIGSTGLATHTVNTATTTVTTLTSSTNPSVFGQSVTFSTRVSSTAGIPTGTVSFFDGSVQLGIATLDSSGNAALTVSPLAIGTHPITVRYAANGNFTASTSSTLNQVVNKANTTTTLSASANTSVFGESVNFIAAVSPVAPGAGTPTGTVTFKNGAVTLGTVTLSNGGIASFSTSSLAASGTPYSITATYNANTQFNASTSASFALSVIPVATITSAVTSPNPSTIGQLVTLTVTVDAINTGIIIPDGTVTASYGSTVIGTGSLNSSGVVTFLTSSLPAGSLPIVINYAGNSNYAPSSTTVIQTVNQSATTTTLSSSLNPSHVGESITLTATVTSGFGTPTGTVSFFDESSLIGTQAINGGGVATLTTTVLTLGSHNIIAVYNGAANFAISQSTTLVQNVIAGITSTSLTSSVNPSSFGQATILTANVSITTGSGVLTGTVTFKDGATTIGTASVSGGSASLTVSNLAIGAHTLTAVYSGDSNFGTSTSPGLTQNVVKATTTTALTSSVNPTTFGGATLLTATLSITSGSGTPTGTVTFKDGATTIGTATISNGQASLSVSNLSVGAHSLTAVYGGDTNFATSTSSIVTQNVTQTSSSTTLASSINPSVFDQSIVLTATVPQGSSPVAPTGIVTFKDGATTIGTGTLSGGIATLNTSTLSVGSHSLTAVYGGDTNFATSTSPILTQVVNQGATNAVLTTSINPSTFGNSVTFTANITPLIGSGVPTGTVTFKDGTTIIGSSALVAGTATLTTSTLSTGTHSITAVYGGDANYTGTTSSSLSQEVIEGNTSTTLTSSTNPSTIGQPVTLTATVSVTSGVGTPTGSVTFFDGATVIGTGTLNAGVASLTVSDFNVGTHSITAGYNGDVNFNGSPSSLLSQVVNQANTTTNILSTSPNPSMFGQNVTFFATVSTPAGTPLATGTVSFYDGASLLGTVPVYDGLSIFATPLLSIGTHLITATYNGDPIYLPSTSSPPTIQVVNQTTITVTTVTTLTSSLNPSNYGDLVTFDMTVTPIAGMGIPTGIITLYSGAVPLTTLPLDGAGHASYSTATLPGGVSTLVALYSGDSNFSSSTATLAQTVIPVTTNSTLTSSVNPSFFNQPVTFSMAVTAVSGAIPTGSVTFNDGATVLGTTNLNNLGVATFTTSSLTAASHPITATYNPDPNFAGSNASLTQVVNPADTITAILTSSPNPSNEGDLITFVASTNSALGTPTGSLTFFDGATPLGTVPLVNGLALFTTSTLLPGTHSITASYAGNASYSPSVSAPYTQVVNQNILATTTILTSSLNPAQLGVPVTFNAQVTSISGTPTGTVTFFSDSVALGNSLISGGMAQITTSSLGLGNHNIVAVYNGDTTYATSTSNTIVEVITISPLPQTPQNFYGYQVRNKFINANERVNILQWSPPQNSADIVSYEIYRNPELTDLVGSVCNQFPFQFEDRKRAKNTVYTYYIVSVNKAGIRSPSVSTDVKPYVKCKD